MNEASTNAADTANRYGTAAADLLALGLDQIRQGDPKAWEGIARISGAGATFELRTLFNAAGERRTEINILQVGKPPLNLMTLADGQKA